MFERFTDRARRVVVLAQEEAPVDVRPLRTICGLMFPMRRLDKLTTGDELALSVPPLGLEPRTCGLKVRSSTN